MEAFEKKGPTQHSIITQGKTSTSTSTAGCSEKEDPLQSATALQTKTKGSDSADDKTKLTELQKPLTTERRIFWLSGKEEAWLCEGSSVLSYMGGIDQSLLMTQQQVDEYIDRFKREKLDAAQQMARMKGGSGCDGTGNGDRANALSNKSSLALDDDSPASYCPLGFKRRLLAAILDGYTAVILKVPSYWSGYTCMYPFCKDNCAQLNDGRYSFFLGPSKSYAHHTLVYTFCLICVEDIFDNNSTTVKEGESRASNITVRDVVESQERFVSQDAVVEAADRLAIPSDAEEGDVEEIGDIAPAVQMGFGSNSVETALLRRKRGRDTFETLCLGFKKAKYSSSTSKKDSRTASPAGRYGNADEFDEQDPQHAPQTPVLRTCCEAAITDEAASQSSVKTKRSTGKDAVGGGGGGGGESAEPTFPDLCKECAHTRRSLAPSPASEPASLSTGFTAINAPVLIPKSVARADARDFDRTLEDTLALFHGDDPAISTHVDIKFAHLTPIVHASVMNGTYTAAQQCALKTWKRLCPESLLPKLFGIGVGVGVGVDIDPRRVDGDVGPEGCLEESGEEEGKRELHSGYHHEDDDDNEPPSLSELLRVLDMDEFI